MFCALQMWPKICYGREGLTSGFLVPGAGKITLLVLRFRRGYLVAFPILWQHADYNGHMLRLFRGDGVGILMLHLFLRRVT